VFLLNWSLYLKEKFVLFFNNVKLTKIFSPIFNFSGFLQALLYEDFASGILVMSMKVYLFEFVFGNITFKGKRQNPKKNV